MWVPFALPARSIKQPRRTTAHPRAPELSPREKSCYVSRAFNGSAIAIYDGSARTRRRTALRSTDFAVYRRGIERMSDVADRVKKIVVEHLGVDEAKVTANASFIADLGAVSLDTVELVMVCE